MPPAVMPTPGAPPDPPTSPAGIWQNRINWAVTIIIALATAYLMILEAKRPSTTLQPTQAPVPATVAPAPAPTPAPAPAAIPDVPAQAEAAYPDALYLDPGATDGQRVDPDFRTPVEAPPVVKVATLILRLVNPVACTGDQIVDFLASMAAKIAPCLINCGAEAAIDSVEQALIVRRVDGSAIGRDSLACVSACGTDVGLGMLINAIPRKAGEKGMEPPTFEVRLIKPPGK